MAYRPDLCAIGYTNYLCPDKYGKLYGDGTSFASPRVAGSIALLMEYNSDLLFSPTLSKAVISVATNTTTAQYSLTNAEEKAGYEKYGAGILNCYNAYRVLKNGTYDDLHTGSPGTLDFSKTLSLSTGQTLRVAVADMIPCSYTSRYNENHKEYVYSGEYGILPDIVVSVMGKNSVSIREQTTSLHVVEYTVTRVGGNQLRIKSVTPINDILLCSYAYVIE